MNPFMVHMVNSKLNQLTAQELVQLAGQYQFPVSMQEANKVIGILRRYNINITNAAQRAEIIEAIAAEVSREKANYIQYLINNYLNR
ncbi:DUF2624 domain-containing protein [Fictibacillus sp. WQ 8-8]|uniref:DUF2624 domain-containing protein n=1 Tax=Fictibacillus marinisediminis TaxID=2878389 RepID=A0A9X1XCR1_9BACL|nr:MULTISPECIES: DUF2624 family protein [Fictibacillus]MCK6257731.1 DUF2624 domain-containing protein [Fictibacillus marinisediminis]MCQ6266247.1 DUF2624 domain-containing protein [Fictibacillus sp. WQ 8-8]MED2972533.1 DUF2624 family protein [Fictibacillus sp. B-59209]